MKKIFALLLVIYLSVPSTAFAQKTLESSPSAVTNNPDEGSASAIPSPFSATASSTSSSSAEATKSGDQKPEELDEETSETRQATTLYAIIAILVLVAFLAGKKSSEFEKNMDQ